ncbi:A/G-specific adenine glycosylase [Allomuricauda sp. SCSIO 65647]|uniref:A/G-specific adenine glycosylase n=1 Tax=Allomuricauda sp. SCSIO 65647 TaxID=2908843 RepID=UPI001F44019D|nr:A/G-specific adenine glycosylase [Muricauda sp. SCSIO 65647]UJH66130.1 A/G-specific adenine glycosylase [Muricauda sp. SCSIO 65647]
MDFSAKILAWYHENKRELPWRKTNDPYNIWLSEVMLQQTRVAQGLPYYEKFIRAFPTVHDLAAASEERVLKLWQGLGYYSRARNMHATAKIIVDERGGSFPDTHKDLLKLKGVGDYTASAIASICFNEPQPVVDGNVYRVLARYFGVDVAINAPKGARYFKALAREVMSIDNIRDYNQGIMEFGAIQCSPRNPRCGSCPLSDSCVALADKRIDELPIKLKKQKIKNRYFNYLVLFDKAGNTLLEQRKGKGIWQNLYQFPLIESEGELDKELLLAKVISQKKFKEIKSLDPINEEPIVHKLSHQHLYTRFWKLKLSHTLNDGISWKNIIDFPVPVLLADFIKTFKF